MAKSKPFHGPRRAYWTITLPSGCCSMHNSKSATRADVQYHLGREDLCGSIKVERTELCAHPGCHFGVVSTRKRGVRCYAESDCPQCATHPCKTVLEAVEA